MKPLPRIRLITVNKNYGHFLAETMDSVIEQRYPDLEYIVLDGASTDNSMAVIEARAKALSFYVSEKDGGQSEAIDKGLKRAAGEIVGWLNSDDLLQPGALATIGTYFHENSSCKWLTAPCITMDGQGATLGSTSVSPRLDLSDLVRGVFLPQPSTFWRRDLHLEAGYLDPRLHYIMDQEFWVRLRLVGGPVHVLGQPLSKERLHDERKTAAPGTAILHERILVAARYLDQLSPHEARIVRSAVRSHERRLLQARFGPGKPPLGELARMVLHHPDMLCNRPTWGLFARWLR